MTEPLKSPQPAQPQPQPRSKRKRRLLGVALGTAALMVTSAAAAWAAPPPSLPQNAGGLEQSFSPAYDYDGDGCYATPAIGADGTLNPGLNPTGAVNGNCRDQSDLDNTNGYSRAKCNNGWCAIMYDLYFEKDQALAGSSIGGHRHDWEHVVVWVQNDQVKYVSTSAHGGFSVYNSTQVRFDGTHAKIVYHKDGIRTHAFRLATSGDEPPENHYGQWQSPDLVGWNGYPAGVRDKLTNANFGSASFGLKDASYNGLLQRAMPAGIPFNPLG